MASLLLQRGDFDGAETAARQALALATEQVAAGRFYRQLSTIAQQRRDLDAAVDFANQALEADPTDAWAHNHLAGLLMQQGKLDAAKAVADTALAISTI